MSLPKLTYFDFAGSRGEEIRLALTIAGMPFEDNRISRDAFHQMKPTLPFGSLPIFEIEGRGVFSQTNAILRLIGRKHGLHPDDPFEAARHDAVMEAAEDLRHRASRTMQMENEQERIAAREVLARDFLPMWARGIEGLIGEGQFVGGASVNVADLKLFMIDKWIAGGGLDHIPRDTFDPFHKLKAVAAGVAAHPAVAGRYNAG
jgi:glutathione S-transferase